MKPRSPDFICIGAQKAGTSWLREQLRKHPQVWMPPVPELHYFDEPLPGAVFPPRTASDRAADASWRNSTIAKLQELARAGNLRDAAWQATHAFLDRDDFWYRSLFAFAPPESLTGDITPRYMLCSDAEITHMHRVAPHAKLLFLLRHPVERFWSQCRMKYEVGTLARGESEAMKLLDSPNGKPRGICSEAILRFCKAFRPEQMLLVFYDGISRQPHFLMQLVFQYLQLPPVPLNAAELEKPVNQSASQEAMPSGLKARVGAAYRSEMELLAGVFGGYASSWLDDHPPVGDFSPVVPLTADHIKDLQCRSLAAANRRFTSNKIFVLSMQRSGTTSVGDWLESHGLVRAGTPTSLRLGWTRLWMQGDYEAIFSSPEFEQAEIFEDDPWWCPGFFQVLAERFPDARFILLERDADAWFESMCHHSAGRNPGWTDVHARIYEREADLQDLLSRQPEVSKENWSLLSIVDDPEHYKAIYQRNLRAVRTFFANQPHRLFYGRLEDPDVFAKICAFVGVSQNPAIQVPRTNARTDAMQIALQKYLQEREAIRNTAPRGDGTTHHGR